MMTNAENAGNTYDPGRSGGERTEPRRKAPTQNTHPGRRGGNKTQVQTIREEQAITHEAQAREGNETQVEAIRKEQNQRDGDGTSDIRQKTATRGSHP